MDKGAIITTREEFVKQAFLSDKAVPVSLELAQSLFRTTKNPAVFNIKNVEWFYVENSDAREIAKRVKKVDEKVVKMNQARIEKGIVGGRPMMDDKEGTPLQVKNRIAKRRSREKMYEANT